MKEHYNRKKKIRFRKHTKNRLYERYNVYFTNQDLKNMVTLIRTGKSKMIKAFSNTRTLHRITYNNIEMVVVYNKYYKEIATAFEKDIL